MSAPVMHTTAMVEAAAIAEKEPSVAPANGAPTRGLPTHPSSTHSLRLQALHFTAAIAYLIAGGVGLVWVAPDIAMGAFAAPRVAGITHLFTLGWLTMTIFGALYQLLPVALGAPIRSRAVAHASFWTFAPGVAFFAAGVATGGGALQHMGIALVSTGVLLAVGNFAATLAGKPADTRDVTWAGMALATAFLASTLVLGIVLLHNLHTGFIAAARVRVLAMHLHVAAVGWVLMMIVGVSHRLLPMFLLAHGANTRWTRHALALLTTGVLSLTAGLYTQLAAVTWLGAVLMMGGVGCYIRQVYAFHRVRIRKRLDPGMRFVAVALGFLVAGALTGPFALATGVAHPRVATAYVLLGLLGGLVLYVIGFFYKIVPLLAWTHRYGGRSGRGDEKLPTVADMFSPRVALVQLVLMAAGVLLLLGGIVVSSLAALGVVVDAGTAATVSAHVARCGAVLFLVGSLLFAGQITRVVFGGTA